MGFRGNKWFSLWGFVLFGGLATASAQLVQIKVLVNDSAGVTPSVLFRGEAEAARLLGAAGIAIEWVNCREGSVEEWPQCRVVPDANEFVLHIVPTGKTSSDSVFGEAFLGADGVGRYCDIFFQRIELAHHDFGASVGQLLGAVSAHELGHLLLGSQAHTSFGIMKPEWTMDSIRQVGMGTLLFTENQSLRMQERARRNRVELSALRIRGISVPGVLLPEEGGGTRRTRPGSPR